VINSGPEATRLLRELQALTGAPVTSTLMGLGAFPADHPAAGHAGHARHLRSQSGDEPADLIVAVGARFDDRVTGRLDAFAPNSKKIHIDIDRASINKTVRVDLPIIGDCGKVLAQLIEAWKAGGHQKADLQEWYARIDGWRARKSLSYPKRSKDIMPQFAIERLYALTRIAIRSSPPKSASTRCGRRSTSTS
jgi:acetolactate synthase-1/2/3 large subunit